MVRLIAMLVAFCVVAQPALRFSSAYCECTGESSDATQAVQHADDDCCNSDRPTDGDRNDSDQPEQNHCDGCDCVLPCCGSLTKIPLGTAEPAGVTAGAWRTIANESAPAHLRSDPHVLGLKRPPRSTTSA